MMAVVTAIGLVFVIEGLLYALAPRHVKHMMATLLRLPDEQLRLAGLIAASFGVGLAWLARLLFGT